MKIHTVKRGETIDTISDIYNVNPSVIRGVNYIPKGKALIEGQELLILVPTRTYTTRYGDSQESVSSKFGIEKASLLLNNPTLTTDSALKAGEVVSIRFADTAKNVAMVNGYFYNGCDEIKLKNVMPFLTHLTVATAIRDTNVLTVLFDDSAAVSMAHAYGKTPLLRIYDTTCNDSLKDKPCAENLCESIVALAKTRGYKGIVIAAFRSFEKENEHMLEFIVSLRKRLIENDMLLFTEIDEKCSLKYTDISDGSVLMYDKINVGDIPSFEEGEIRTFSKIASSTESSKIFVDLPSLALLSNGRYVAYCEGIEKAKGSTIRLDEKALLCKFDYTETDGKRHTAVLPSLKNTEAKLRLISELDFLGISFDIMRAPITYLSMFNALFKTVPYTSV